MTLRTLEPAPDWDPEEHADAVAALAALDEEFTFTVWGDDGCGDCQRRLPALAAALRAAGVPDDRVRQIEVERLPEGEKRGPLVDAYGIERIPTVVVERDGEEVARFVEKEPEPIPEFLAARLREVGAIA